MRAKIDDIAADWVAREDRAPLTPAERARLEAWKAEDVRHRGAHARAQAVFIRAGRAEALGAGFCEESTPAIAGQGRRRWLWMLASAAVLAVVMPALPRMQWAWEASRVHQTDIGQVLRVPLPDGSVATLNSATRVRLAFDPDQRLLLLEQGEALLDVAKDKARPFIVRTGKTDVVAVGTSFSVRRHTGGDVDVLVREGTVDIRKSGAASGVPAPVRVAANHSVAYTPAGPRVGELPAREVQSRLAWRDGLIVFEGDTMAEAASEFARYSHYRIVIDDPALAQLRVVGVFASTDPAGFTRAVASSFGLQRQNVPGGVRLLPATQDAATTR